MPAAVPANPPQKHGRAQARPEARPETRGAARMRWTLTTLASLFLLTFLIGGFGSLALAWTTGRVSLGSRGFTIFLYDQPHTDPTGLFADWSWKPRWEHAAWWRLESDMFAFSASLLVPGVVLGLLAASRWYRRARPFHRTGRKNRAYQFVRSRWLLTFATLLTLLAAGAGHWREFCWLTPYHKVTIHEGRLWWYGAGDAGVSWVGTLTVVPATTPALAPGVPPMVATPPPYFILYEWLRPGSTPMLEVSLWFAGGALAAIAFIFWFVRFRFYPADGRCTNPTCGYDLTGIEEGMPCPECGRTAIPPANASPSGIA